MIKLIKHFIMLIVSGASTLFIAACYGMPVNFEEYYKTIVITAKNRMNSPIPGLKVSLQKLNTDTGSSWTTSGLGKAYIGPIDDLTNDLTYSVKITDVDGEENYGVFKDQVIRLKPQQSDYDVTMDN